MIPANSFVGKSRYRVIKELNRGGTAVVYEAEDLVEKRNVALKVMSLRDGKATMPLSVVKREVEYASSLHHPNIVRLVDFVSDDQRIIIVWELIDGVDLLDLLNECGGRMDEREAAFYFSQLLQAVTFIHANGLCHRDLKPENCMIDRATRKLKVIDFGLSKHQASAVTLGVGTPDYMSPELLSGAGAGVLNERRTGQYDARAIDVWAMGVMLYLLVSGQYPFEDPAEPQNMVRTLQNISAGRVRPLPRRVSPECASLLGAMLTRDPSRRINLQQIAEHPWLHMATSFSFAKAKDSLGATTPRIVNISAATLPVPVTPDAMVGRLANKDTIVKVTKDEESVSKSNKLGSICKLWFGSH